VHFSILGIQRQDNPLLKAVLKGNDLLHGDLVPENILLGKDRPVVLDPESVCVGHLAWDAAQALAHILQVDESDPIAHEFLDRVGLSGGGRELTWSLIKLFMSIGD